MNQTLKSYMTTAIASKALLMLLLICFISLTHAQDLVRTQNIERSINLSQSAEVTFTDPNILLSDVIDIGSWDKKFSLTPLPNNKVMWTRFSLQNNQLSNEDLTLIAGNTFIERIDAYIIDGQGRIVESIQRNYSEDIFYTETKNDFLLSFNIRPDQMLTIYIRVQDDGPATLPIEVWKTEAFEAEEASRYILLGALSGGLSLLATYFLITYIVRNIPSRFWFAIFSVSVMTTLLSAEGILPNLFALPRFGAEITAFALMITIFSAIKLSRIIFVPLSTQWLRGNYILLGAPAFSLLLSSDYWQMVALLAIILIFLVSKLFATYLFKNKMDQLSTGFYFIGWMILTLVASIEFLSFVIGVSHFTDSSTLSPVLACLGVMLIGVAIISKEQYFNNQQENQQTQQINDLREYLDLFQHSPDGLFIADSLGQLKSVNPQLSHLFGFVDGHHLLTKFKTVSDFFVDSKAADLINGELQIQHEIVGREIKGKRLDGSEFWFSLSCNVTKSKNETFQYGTIFDVTERQLHLINQQYLTTHDQLTGLFNRRQLLNVLKDNIDKDLKNNPIALFFIDVDQFKLVNDACGYLAGDLYIKEFSHHLFETVHQHICFARLNSDKFCLVTHFESQEKLKLLAQSIISQVNSFEFTWNAHNFNHSVSIGIAIGNSTNANPEEILSNADSACTIAKGLGEYKVYIFNEKTDQNTKFERDLLWINEIKRALSDQQFSLYCQPYRALSSSDEKACFEVLLRLTSTDGQIILPEHFMPIAERYGLSEKIDTWTIEHTFSWLHGNEKALKDVCSCSINISSGSISNEEFRYFLLNAFKKYKISYDRICFEISENTAIIKMNETLAFINEFRDLGCKFALDDFGSGFSSYDYLKSLPVNYIKIDGKFVRDILRDPIDYAMVTSIRDIAQAMSIKTIAKFVESEELLVQLGKMGIDYAQGFIIAKPTLLEDSELN